MIQDDPDLPILTDVVELRAPTATGSTGLHTALEPTLGAEPGIHNVEELAALQADLVNRTLNLADELLHTAARDLEGVLFERVLERLRTSLPELVAVALREHLKPRDD